MQLITDEIRTLMLANGVREAAANEAEEDIDLPPAVKLFNPTGAQTWLLTSLYPGDPDIAFGLCDLGMGCPELGDVRISELQSFKGRMGLGIERDIRWQATHPLSAYTEAANRAGRIVDRLPMPSQDAAEPHDILAP
jgi:hypothetical protein